MRAPGGGAGQRAKQAVKRRDQRSRQRQPAQATSEHSSRPTPRPVLKQLQTGTIGKSNREVAAARAQAEERQRQKVAATRRRLAPPIGPPLTRTQRREQKLAADVTEEAVRRYRVGTRGTHALTPVQAQNLMNVKIGGRPIGFLGSTGIQNALEAESRRRAAAQPHYGTLTRAQAAAYARTSRGPTFAEGVGLALDRSGAFRGVHPRGESFVGRLLRYAPARGHVGNIVGYAPLSGVSRAVGLPSAGDVASVLSHPGAIGAAAAHGVRSEVQWALKHPYTVLHPQEAIGRHFERVARQAVTGNLAPAARDVELYSGIDPLHPLNRGRAALGFNLGLLIVPGLGGRIRTGREGIRAVLHELEAARVARQAGIAQRPAINRLEARIALEAHPYRNEFVAEIDRQAAEGAITKAEATAYKRKFETTILKESRRSRVPIDELLGHPGPTLERPVHPPHSFAEKDIAKRRKVRQRVEADMAAYQPKNLPATNEIIDQIVGKSGMRLLGPITVEQRASRALQLMSPELRADWARFYRDVWPQFAAKYGETDTRKAMAWFIGQRAAGPGRGIMDLQRVLEGASGKIGLAVGEQRPLLAAAEGTPIGSKGIGAKISDFLDAGHGKSTRTIMGDHPDMGGPFVVDRWSYRSDGFLDADGLRKLRELGYTPEQLASLKVDSLGDNAYEYSSIQGDRLTQYFNDHQIDGRSNWTHDEVQAIDWAATQLDWGTQPENIAKAFESNQRVILATRGDEQALAAIVESYPGVQLLPESTGTRLVALASPEAHAAIAQEIADATGRRVLSLRMNMSAANRGLIEISGSDAAQAAREITQAVESIGHVHVSSDLTADLVTRGGLLSPEQVKLAQQIADAHGVDLHFSNTELEVYRGEARDIGRGADQGGIPGGAGADRAPPAPTADQNTFVAALRANSRGWNLTEHTAEDLASKRLFLSADGQTGYAIDPQGDLQNLFNNSLVKGAGTEALFDGIRNGARTLDAYDGFLSDLYDAAGFVETGRMRFSDAYAPPNWDYLRGRPDVVFMGFGAEPLAKPAYFTDWDKAKQAALDASQELPQGTGLRDWLRSRRLSPGLGSGIPLGLETERSAVEMVAGTAPEAARTLSLGEHEQQLRMARSKLSQAIVDRPVDMISELAQGSERLRRIPVVRKITTEQRVTKAAGRTSAQVRRREEAKMARHVKVVRDVKGADAVAQFIYAQLPAKLRNVEGLERVRARQARHLSDLTDGSYVQRLEGAQADLAAQRDELKFGSPEWSQLTNELEHLELLKADVPRRIDDTAAGIAQLDATITAAPKVDGEMIDSIRALSNERERILIESGRLEPERAAARKGLLSEWIGEEPTGEEIYIGHRGAQLGGRLEYAGAPSVGGGRVRSPRGLGKKNQLSLAASGRWLAAPEVAANDWQHAQVFALANRARADLWRMAGKAGSYKGKIGADELLLNPKGKTYPAHWKTDELQNFGEGWEDVEKIRQQADEILAGFRADGSDPEAVAALLRAADAAGTKRSDLRVIKKDLAENYFKQTRTMKPPRGKALKAYDTGIDMVATSIIFARLGYIPKNVVQNVVLTSLHQGAFLPRNLARAGQVMADTELRHTVLAEVGRGSLAEQGAELATSAAGKVGRATVKGIRKVADVSGSVADDTFRASAFLHEAARAGVISKGMGLLGEADKAKLLRFLRSTDPADQRLLTNIHQWATDSVADFQRMTPDQARMARRLFVIPSWLVAGTRYPFIYAYDHPIRTALMAYIAAGEPGAPDELQFNRPLSPSWLGISTGGTPSYLVGPTIAGRTFRTGSLSPVSTPVDLEQAIQGTIQGVQPFDFSSPTAFDFANPAIRFAVDLAQGRSIVPTLEGLVPGEKFIRGLIDPAASAHYPGDSSRWERLFRELGVVPIKVSGTGSHAKMTSDWISKTLPFHPEWHGDVPNMVRDALQNKQLVSEKLAAYDGPKSTYAEKSRASATALLEVAVQKLPALFGGPKGKAMYDFTKQSIAADRDGSFSASTASELRLDLYGNILDDLDDDRRQRERLQEATG